jgi:uncharacterized protein (DUF58 family)
MARWVVAAGLGLLLGTAGAIFGVWSLTAAGGALAALALLARAWVSVAVSGLGTERVLAARTVVEDEPVTVRLRVSPTLWIPGGEIHDGLLPQPVEVAPGGRGARIRVVARFDRRGRRTLPPGRVVIRDPFGFAQSHRPLGELDELLVLPRVEPLRPPGGAGDPLSAAGMAALAGAVADADVDGLRPLRDGTPASRIHWPAFARGAGLHERRVLPEADAQPLVVLDTRGPRSVADLDAAVRAAASLCHALATAGGCGLLLPGERRQRPIGEGLRGWTDAWSRLALVEASALPPAPAAIARARAIIWVSARAGVAPPLAGRRGADVRIHVRPRLEGAPPAAAVLQVAGCDGVLLGAAGRVAA